MSKIVSNYADERLDRHQAILKIISEKSMGTQQDLARAIQKSGFTCTQATISRDLLDLRIAKVNGSYRAWEEAGIRPLERVMMEHAVSVAPAGLNLVVLKTQIGSAQTVGIEIDRSNFQDVVGTIAGDDTIFIAVANKKAQEAVLKQLRHFVKGE